MSSMSRTDLAFRLNGYNYDEIEQAMSILQESSDDEVSYRDIRRIWECVSQALDHHQDSDNELPGLVSLEGDLCSLGELSNAPFGIEKEKNIELGDMPKQFGITRDRIRKIEKKALRKLRGGDDDPEAA